MPLQLPPTSRRLTLPMLCLYDVMQMSLLLYDGGNARSVLRVLNDEPISAATFREAVVRLCGADGKLLAWRLLRLEQAQSMTGGLASALGTAHKCLKELREASALHCFMCRKGEGQEGEVHGRRVMVEPCGHVLCDDHAGPITATGGPTAKARDTCPACAQRATKVIPLPSAEEEEEEEEDSLGEGRGGEEGREERRPAFRLQHKPVFLLFAAVKTEREQAQVSRWTGSGFVIWGRFEWLETDGVVCGGGGRGAEGGAQAGACAE